MADQPTDHDRIITLESHVNDLRHWRDVLSEHLDTKFNAMDQKIDTRFTALDNKVDKKLDSLQDHLDHTFNDLRDKMDNTLRDLRLALPHWAQIAIYFLVGTLGLLGGLLVWRG
jgi:hypothetical protein